MNNSEEEDRIQRLKRGNTKPGHWLNVNSSQFNKETINQTMETQMISLKYRYNEIISGEFIAKH